MEIDLSCGGKSWAGFVFKPWGKAKEWRLYLPGGGWVSALEILKAYQMSENYDWVNREYQKMLEQRKHEDGRGAAHFTEQEAIDLYAVIEIIKREVPYPRRRPKPVQVVNNSAPKLKYR